ncbi:MAG: signal peptide peptidase SppA, partial [Planctomycetota bacterium]
MLLASPGTPASLADEAATDNPVDRILEMLKGDDDEAADEEDRDEDAEEADDDESEASESDKPRSAADRIREMREKAEAENAKSLIAQIDFSSPISEKPMGASLFGGAGLDLRSVLARLEQAKNDEDCEAVLFTFYYGGMMNFAQAQEIIVAMNELKDAGKRIFVYADTYDTMSYYLASAATDVVLMDGGEIFIPGISIEPMFYNDALNKFGIQADYVQVGEYKGAEEPYTRNSPSPELTEEMESLVNAIYGQIVDQIADGRDLRSKRVKKMIDGVMLPAADAVKAGFVDHLADADGLRDLMAEELDNEVRLDPAYGTSDEAEFDPENPLPALMALLNPPEVDAQDDSVALIYAEGVITGGEGGGGLFSAPGIGSETIRRAMRMALRDDEIKAVVIRIDSPGGSALASEAMYQSIRRVAEEKPVVISIGGMAASGGYYMAVAGDKIYADPAAIVGSIGVVGGKLVWTDLYDMLGLSTASFTKGKNANLFSSTSSWDDKQRDLVRNWMTSTYEQFTDRVMSTREGKIEDIDEVAKGRIFLAEQAIDLGMVDELGGGSGERVEAAVG